MSTDGSDWALLQKGLWPLAAVYGLVAACRNYLYDLGVFRSHGVDVPVVAVGNLSTGGTGKTPLVVWLVEEARKAGRRPGVLARGYGRRAGAALNDEGLLLARRFDSLPQVQDPNRVAGARRLAEMGVDLIIVDDGFQHRRLRRDRDLVCLDTARPFAGGMLPVGRLREFPRGLRRADVLVLTRAGGYEPGDVARRMEQMRELAGENALVLAADHRPARLIEIPGGRELPLTELRGKRVYLLSAIARPETFSSTVEELGAEVVGHSVQRDHHHHTAQEIDAVGRSAAAAGAVLVTTEKDEVKLTEIATPRWVLELDLEFLAPGADFAAVVGCG